MFTSRGILHYGPPPKTPYTSISMPTGIDDVRAVVDIDHSIIEYYRSLIPKYYSVTRQRYDGHITVVRTGREYPPKMEVWGKHQGQSIEFQYDPCIQREGVYWFLNVYSEQIGDIREELGLPRFRFKDRPCYHLSLANNKSQ